MRGWHDIDGFWMLDNFQQKLNGIPDFFIWRGNNVGRVASLVGSARLCSIARYSPRQAASY
jgi:hypothetical protein